MINSNPGGNAPERILFTVFNGTDTTIPAATQVYALNADGSQVTATPGANTMGYTTQPIPPRMSGVIMAWGYHPGLATFVTIFGSGGGGGAADSIETCLEAALPATSAVGDIRFVTDADTSAGLSNIFMCFATNTWTQTGLIGDADGSIIITEDEPGVKNIQANLQGNVALLADDNTYTGGGLQDFGTSVIDLGRLAADPGTAVVGSIYFNTTLAKFRMCLTTNVWTTVAERQNLATANSGYLTPLGRLASANTAAIGTNVMHYQEFVCPANILLKYFILRSESGAGTGQYISCGIYNAAGTLVAQTDVIDATTLVNANIIFTFATATQLEAGVPYFFAWSASGTATITLKADSSNLDFMLNALSTKRTFTGANASTGTSAMTFPAAMGARTFEEVDPITVPFVP